MSFWFIGVPYDRLLLGLACLEVVGAGRHGLDAGLVGLGLCLAAIGGAVKTFHTCS